MNMMDWGDIGDFVSFGEVGRDQIDDASYYILIAPQNVVGSTILTNLGDMVCSLHSVELLCQTVCPTVMSHGDPQSMIPQSVRMGS